RDLQPSPRLGRRSKRPPRRPLALTPPPAVTVTETVSPIVRAPALLARGAIETCDADEDREGGHRREDREREETPVEEDDHPPGDEADERHHERDGGEPTHPCLEPAQARLGGDGRRLGGRHGARRAHRRRALILFL